MTGHCMKTAWLLAVWLLALLPLRAEVERSGHRVEPFDPLATGAFKWEIASAEQPDGSIQFHVTLTLSSGWPKVRLDRNPSAGLAHVNTQARYVGEIRELPFRIEGKTVSCDFAVSKADLADPTICFSFLLYSEEKNFGTFAWLNDFFGFPDSAIAQLRSEDADVRALAARKIADATRFAEGSKALSSYVPKLIPFLDSDDEAVRKPLVMAALCGLKTHPEVIPALIRSLDAKAGVKALEWSQQQIILVLDQVDFDWRSRPEVTERIRKLPYFPRPLDG